MAAINFLELIHYIERITDNCKNVAEAVMDDISRKLSVMQIKNRFL